MPRPLTRRQARENARFLQALARTGNVRLAARELGVNRSTYTKRRSRHPAFAADWNKALEAANAALFPSRLREGPGEGLSQPLRTNGGEPTITRLATGRLQLRRAQPGRITKAAEQVFLAALAETANIRLAAAEAGFAHSSFLARARRDPAFAHEMRVEAAIGRDRLVWAEVERALRPAADPDFNPDIPIPPMSAEQALLQLIYHRPDGPFQRRRRRTRPPPFEEVAPRIRAKASAIKRHSHFVKTGDWRFPHEILPGTGRGTAEGGGGGPDAPARPERSRRACPELVEGARRET